MEEVECEAKEGSDHDCRRVWQRQTITNMPNDLLNCPFPHCCVSLPYLADMTRIARCIAMFAAEVRTM
jgi:hypothetical protein